MEDIWTFDTVCHWFFWSTIAFCISYVLIRLQKQLDDNGYPDGLTKTIFIFGLLLGAVAIPHWLIWWLVWYDAENNIIEKRIIEERSKVRELYVDDYKKGKEAGFQEGWGQAYKTMESAKNRSLNEAYERGYRDGKDGVRHTDFPPDE